VGETIVAAPSVDRWIGHGVSRECANHPLTPALSPDGGEGVRQATDGRGAFPQGSRPGLHSIGPPGLRCGCRAAHELALSWRAHSLVVLSTTGSYGMFFRPWVRRVVALRKATAQIPCRGYPLLRKLYMDRGPAIDVGAVPQLSGLVETPAE